MFLADPIEGPSSANVKSVIPGLEGKFYIQIMQITKEGKA